MISRLDQERSANCGGTTSPHQIGPDQAKALAFLTGGKLAFAARVNLPAIYCQTTEDAAHP
ncbi:MAG: hypothetical protein WA280_12530 [Xanthobacteraceae bacterium]